MTLYLPGVSPVEDLPIAGVAGAAPGEDSSPPQKDASTPPPPRKKRIVGFGGDQQKQLQAPGPARLSVPSPFPRGEGTTQRPQHLS
jgi:hypothetical protein